MLPRESPVKMNGEERFDIHWDGKWINNVEDVASEAVGGVIVEPNDTPLNTKHALRDIIGNLASTSTPKREQTTVLREVLIS